MADRDAPVMSYIGGERVIVHISNGNFDIRFGRTL